MTAPPAGGGQGGGGDWPSRTVGRSEPSAPRWRSLLAPGPWHGRGHCTLGHSRLPPLSFPLRILGTFLEAQSTTLVFECWTSFPSFRCVLRASRCPVWRPVSSRELGHRASGLGVAAMRTRGCPRVAGLCRVPGTGLAAGHGQPGGSSFYRDRTWTAVQSWQGSGSSAHRRQRSRARQEPGLAGGSERHRGNSKRRAGPETWRRVNIAGLRAAIHAFLRLSSTDLSARLPCAGIGGQGEMTQ